MRIARFRVDETVSFGLVEGDGDDAVVSVLDGHPFGPLRTQGVALPLASVRLLAPVLPTKVVGVGRNYAEHAKEMGATELSEEPVLFLKPSTAVVGPDEAIVLPPGAAEVHHEAELAVVVGGLVPRYLPAERALDYVLGYTAGNDVSARDKQRADGQWARAKGYDTFCPLGPWIQTDLDPTDVGVRCLVNGQVRQDGRTADMLVGVADLIAFISTVMTLLPGDVILTGTPAGVGPLRAGDLVSVHVDAVGTLTNRVVARGE